MQTSDPPLNKKYLEVEAQSCNPLAVGVKVKRDCLLRFRRQVLLLVICFPQYLDLFIHSLDFPGRAAGRKSLHVQWQLAVSGFLQFSRRKLVTALLIVKCK